MDLIQQQMAAQKHQHMLNMQQAQQAMMPGMPPGMQQPPMPGMMPMGGGPPGMPGFPPAPMGGGMPGMLGMMPQSPMGGWPPTPSHDSFNMPVPDLSAMISMGKSAGAPPPQMPMGGKGGGCFGGKGDGGRFSFSDGPGGPPINFAGGGPDSGGGGPANFPPTAANFPSMEQLAKNSQVGGSSSTVQDDEVKVLDFNGRPMAHYDRYATFEDTPFPASIKAVLARAGFPAPSQIQQYCWPLGCADKDVIGVAATGSGKTLTFLLPAFKYILEHGVRAGDASFLVMAPTRELAVQIEEEAVKFGSASGIKTVCCYGGAPKHEQAQAIRSGVHGVIGTPGRLNDFVEGGQLRLGSVHKLILDEADRMLDMGFEPQIRKILAQIPSQRHTMFFTATWPKSVGRIANEFLRSATQVQIGNRDELKGNQDITQTVRICTGYEKQRVLMDILKQGGIASQNGSDCKGLVFCGTKKMCDQLAQQLSRQGVPSNAIHGDKNQKEREQALADLKSGQIKTLVATDVAARGIDIKGVTLVVNYDLPANTEDYVHRIGRTGRAGQKGYAVALVTDRDAHALKGIIAVMKRTNQEVSPEAEQMAANAGPAPPPMRRGKKGGDKGGGDFYSSGGKSGGKSGGNDTCGDFQRGTCTRGDSCRFSHGGGGGGGGGGSMGGGGMPPMMPVMGMPPMGMPFMGGMGMPGAMPGMPPMGMPGMPGMPPMQPPMPAMGGDYSGSGGGYGGNTGGGDAGGSTRDRSRGRGGDHSSRGGGRDRSRSGGRDRSRGRGGRDRSRGRRRSPSRKRSRSRKKSRDRR